MAAEKNFICEKRIDAGPFSGQYSIEAIFELVLLRQVWDHITDLHRTRDRMLVVLESTVHVRSPNEQDRRAASAVTGEVLGRIADRLTSRPT